MKILSMPAGVPANTMLYDNGVWNVPYDNPGSYTRTGFNVQGYVLSGSIMYAGGASNIIYAVGTANAIDLTDYKMLHIKARSTSGTGALKIMNSKDLASTEVASLTIPVSTPFVDYAIDVTALTGSYFIVCNNYNTVTEIAEIYLSK